MRMVRYPSPSLKASEFPAHIMKIMRIGQKQGFDWMKDVYKHNRGHALPKNQIIDDEGKHGPRPTTNYEEDIADIGSLQSEAHVLAELKGHHLGNWKNFSNGGRNYSSSTCELCGMQVQVCDKPMANEQDMSGLAINLTCGQD